MEELEVQEKAALCGDIWEVAVVRHNFHQTAQLELAFANEADWRKKLQVTFVGEEGCDEGGVAREFFSLLFTNNEIMDGNTFRLHPILLQKQQYKIYGQCVAYAILTGHPGPRNLNQATVKYLLDGALPDTLTIPLDDVPSQEVVSCMNRVRHASKY